MFKQVAKHYDLVMADFDYRNLVDYLDDLIIENGGERTSLLDIACGTGSELFYFRQLGYTLAGLDMSQEMLSVAEEKLPGIELFCADMTKFELPEKFDNVICVFDSINYLLDETKLLNCFKSVNKAMNPQGLFLFDFNTAYGLLEEWQGTKTEEGEGYYMVYESVMDYDRLNSKTRIKFFIKEEDGRYITFEENHSEKGYTKEQMSVNLKKAGFEIVAFLPFLKKNRARTSHIDRYQVVARKIK